jgi:hypothetical protein
VTDQKTRRQWNWNKQTFALFTAWDNKLPVKVSKIYDAVPAALQRARVPLKHSYDDICLPSSACTHGVRLFLQEVFLSEEE